MFKLISVFEIILCFQMLLNSKNIFAETPSAPQIEVIDEIRKHIPEKSTSHDGIELDFTGISTHLASDFHNGGEGIFIDPNGVFVFNPGLSVSGPLSINKNIHWKTTVFLDCNLLPFVFAGINFRYKMQFTANKKVVFNLYLAAFSSTNWSGSGFTFGIIPIPYFQLISTDEKGIESSFKMNGALAPQMQHVDPLGGAPIYFSFFSLPLATLQKVAYAVKSKVWQKQVLKDKIIEYAN